MHLHKCDHVFFYLGKKSGGVVRLTAKPRYLLLLHRGEKKSNTVTALAATTNRLLSIMKIIDNDSHYRLVGSAHSARPTSAGCVKLQH